MKTQEDKVAFMAALSAFTGIFESFIPTPVPFLRLGLANIPVCLGFAFFTFPQMAFIIGFKVIMIHLFRGSLFSYPFLLSLSGNLLLLIGVSLFYRAAGKKVSFISINIVAAFLHNIGQVTVSFLFLPYRAVLYYGVILLSLGTIFGLINGLFCNRLYNRVVKRMLT